VRPGFSNTVRPPGHRNDIRAPLAKSRPGFHEQPSLFESIAAPVSPLCRIARYMGKRRFRNLTRERRCLAAPITEGRAEAVNRRAMNLQSVHYFGHRHMRQRLSTANAHLLGCCTFGIALLVMPGSCQAKDIFQKGF
jgi:hypothetical protein